MQWAPSKRQDSACVSAGVCVHGCWNLVKRATSEGSWPPGDAVRLLYAATEPSRA